MLVLRAMTQDELDARLPALHEEYADDEVRAGRDRPETVRANVAALFRQLLPNGVATAGHLLFSGVDDTGAVVGWIWLALPGEKRPQAWVYDIQVDPEYRRRGFGRALMLAAEDELRARGVFELGLNVFGHNVGAQALYSSIGFQIKSTTMAKDLRR
ncbi:GNAT family N-acetyltransferase [Dactylosporangium sp. NPDC051541]|uniref:GNAT family N-acetyltransferase n=1 Tax=Dactylosporangium sp. NPDC051541 TaxID=3363977 RepID=UPI003794DD52